MLDALLVAVDLALVVVVARCVGALAVRFGEPRIAGEMVGAILVGPTFLGGQVGDVVDGAGAGGIVGALFPPVGVDVVTVVGSVGMILYMLLVGMAIDMAPMGRRAGSILLQALAAVAATCAVAVGAALWLGSVGGWRGPDVTSVAFALALSAALTAQGVPMAARILEERGLMRCEIGANAIAVGATITMIALIMSGVAIRGGDGAATEELAFIVAGAVVVLAIGAPLGHSRWMRLSPRVAVAALLVIALGAGAGGKALFGTILIGPLVVGMAVRSAGFSAGFLEARLGMLVRGVLLPVFLVVAALHANLRELLHADTLAQALVLVAAIVLAKTLAGVGSARVAGFGPAQARVMGAVGQCGGVMTVAVSLDLLRAGIVTTRTHALMMLVGLVTTLLAGPLLARSGLGAQERPLRPLSTNRGAVRPSQPRARAARASLASRRARWPRRSRSAQR
jgi:Kef-type K+ transport system membrane component KefB